MSIASVHQTTSVDTRRALTAEVLSEVVERGIDEVSVSALCLAVNISRPTFYSRYGNVDGLLAEAFLEKGEAWLDGLIGPTFDQSWESEGLARILAAGCRKPEVAEVVYPMVGRWWNGIEQKVPRGPASWLVANRLGVLLSVSLQPEVVATLGLEPLFLALMERPDLASASPGNSSLSLEAIALDDPVLDAAFGVIAYAGYHGSSMSRIARAIRVTTGALYPHYENSLALVNEVYRQAQQQVVAANSSIWRELELTIENFGQFVSEGLGPARNRWRALRRETLLAGEGFNEVKGVARESLNEMARNLDPVVEYAKVPEFARPAVRYVFHTLGVGFGVMKDANLPVDLISHMGVAASLSALMAEANR